MIDEDPRSDPAKAGPLPGEPAAAPSSDDPRFLRSILQAAPVYIVRAGADLRIRFINRAPGELTPADFVGRSILDFCDGESRALSERMLTETLATGQVTNFEMVITRPNGQVVHYDCRAVPTPDEGGAPGITLMALDVSAQRERERELRNSRERLHVAIEATGVGVCSWDLVKNQVEWNDRMYAIMGFSEPIAGPEFVDRAVHPDDRELFRRELRESFASGGSTIRASGHRIVRPDGTVRWVLPSGMIFRDEQGKPVRVVGGVLDVTPNRELVEQLRQAQKMEAVGKLAAGVAHNFNNMLAVMIPVLELSRPYLPDTHAALVDQALHAGGRAAEMVQQLLTFAGKRLHQARTAQPIEEIVRRAVGICERLFQQRVTVQYVVGAVGALVHCDAGQIEQAVVNVLLNARDAVLEARPQGGTIRVTLSVLPAQELTPDGLRRNLPAYVRVRIEDDGIGMSEEVRHRVFEPFFTTKEPGRGTGLGLATTFTILQEHGGFAACSSEPRAGTTFDLCLPLVENESP